MRVLCVCKRQRIICHLHVTSVRYAARQAPHLRAQRGGIHRTITHPVTNRGDWGLILVMGPKSYCYDTTPNTSLLATVKPAMLFDNNPSKQWRHIVSRRATKSAQKILIRVFQHRLSHTTKAWSSIIVLQEFSEEPNLLSGPTSHQVIFQKQTVVKST